MSKWEKESSVIFSRKSRNIIISIILEEKKEGMGYPLLFGTGYLGQCMIIREGNDISDFAHIIFKAVIF